MNAKVIIGADAALARLPVLASVAVEARIGAAGIVRQLELVAAKASPHKQKKEAPSALFWHDPPLRHAICSQARLPSWLPICPGSRAGNCNTSVASRPCICDERTQNPNTIRDTICPGREPATRVSSERLYETVCDVTTLAGEH